MTGPEANERFDHWVEQCRQQLERGAAGNALAAWMLSEGVGSDTAAAILRAAQTPPIAGLGPSAPEAAVAQDGAAPAINGAAPEVELPQDGSTPAPDAGTSPAFQAETTIAAAAVVPSPQPPVAAETAAAVFAKAFGKSRQLAGGTAAVESGDPQQPAPVVAASAPDQPLPPAHDEAAEPLAPPAAAIGEPLAMTPAPSLEPQHAELAAPQYPPAFAEPSAPVPPTEPAAMSTVPPAMAMAFSQDTRFETAAPIPPSSLFGTPRLPVEAPAPAGRPDDLSERDVPEQVGPEPVVGPDETLHAMPLPGTPSEDIAAPDAAPVPDLEDVAGADGWADEDGMSAAGEETDVGEPASFAPDGPGPDLDDAEPAIALAEDDLPGPDGTDSGSLTGPQADVHDPDLPPSFTSEDFPAAGDTDAEDEEFEFPDSLEDAAAHMAMSLSDPLRDPPAESYEDFLGGAQDRDREAEAEPDEMPSRVGGKRVIELRDEAGRPATQPAAEGELARAIREAGEAMPGAVSDAPEGELARAVREAEGKGGAAAHAGPAAEDTEGLDEAGRDIREPEADRAAEPGPPSEEFGPATEEQLARAARELGISFRDEPGAELHEDPELERAARELGISFRDDPKDGDLADRDDETARVAQELGISFRDGESGTRSRSKQKKSTLARYWPILLLIALAAAAMPVLAVFTMYWSQ